jgi:hypothetical protein
LQLNLPVCPVHDLVLKDDDLVVATHGRSFWILDDVTPLHQISDEVMASEVHLFQPRTAVRHAPNLFEDWSGGSPGKNYVAAFTNITTFVEEKTEEGTVKRRFLDAGKNPPDGVIVTYYLQEKPEHPVHLSFQDAAGNTLKAFTIKPAEDVTRDKTEEEKYEEEGTIYVAAQAGMNRFVWNMKVEDSQRLKKTDLSGSKVSGPRVVPGTYQVMLTVGQESRTQLFEIVTDPRVTTPLVDLQAQFELLIQIRDKVSEGNTAVNQIRDMRQQVEGWLGRVTDDAAPMTALTAVGQQLKEKLAEVEKPLIEPGLKTLSEILNHGTRLIAKMAALAPVVFSADFKPTQAAQDVYAKLADEIDEQLAQLHELIEVDVAAFNGMVQERGMGALGV